MALPKGQTFPRVPCRRCGVVVVHTVDKRHARDHWCPHTHAGGWGRRVRHRCAPFATQPFLTPGGYQYGCLECAFGYKGLPDLDTPHTTQSQRNAAVFYEGPSQLTGDPIVAVLTGLSLRSHNRKTGHLLQVYIIRPDMDPTEAIATGADRAMCGDCSLRGNGVHGRGCYVTWWQAPQRVYSALDKRPRVNPWELRDSLVGQMVRLGAYGDPVAVPITVWAALLSRAGGWVGYTQQWRTCDPGYRFWLMASCLNEADYYQATAAGWRTYRVRRPDEPILDGECICPASEEADHALTCQQCRLCAGVGLPRERANAAIIAHGKLGNLKVFGIRGLKPVGRRPADPNCITPSNTPQVVQLGGLNQERRRPGRPKGSKNRPKVAEPGRIIPVTSGPVPSAPAPSSPPVPALQSSYTAPIKIAAPVTLATVERSIGALKRAIERERPQPPKLPSTITQAFLVRARFGPAGSPRC